MLNMGIITSGDVCVCIFFPHKMNTFIHSWIKLAYQIICMPTPKIGRINTSRQSSGDNRQAEAKTEGSRSRGRCGEGDEEISGEI